MPHVELRGDPAGHLAPNWPRERQRHTLECLAQSGVQPWVLVSYAVFNACDAASLRANAEMLQHNRLTEAVGAPFVRANIGMPGGETPPLPRGQW